MERNDVDVETLSEDIVYQSVRNYLKQEREVQKHDEDVDRP